MNTLQKQPQTAISPRELQRRLAVTPAVCLIDVRSPAEFSAAHVPGARLVPLDTLDAAAFAHQRAGDPSPVYFLCHSGGRAQRAIEKLAAAGLSSCVLIEGGTQAWIDAGLPVNRGASRVLPLMRQVQIVVGFLGAAGAALALLVDSRFALIPLVIGCGLIFAGITGYCGLAMLLARMPWNKSTSANCPT